MSVVATNQLTRVFGRKDAAFTALHAINISIEAGDSVAVIGKSGSGKSTLMHLLALLDMPTSGSVLVNDEPASRLSARQIDRLRNRNYGFVFQQFFLNGNDTVLNNVILPLKIAGVNRRERSARGLAVLKAVELGDKAGSKAADLSGGQKQRLCIARALINNPKVIFADEPTGNLDSATGEAIINLLFKLNKDHGITLIVVTHDPDLADRCQRQIRIKDGRVEGEK
ncbi:MAG: ABC transporter ATP-binding protein [Candidatus Saccharibacteria bacterium]